MLDDIPALALSADETRRLKHGQTISFGTVIDQPALSDINQDTVLCAQFEGDMIALVKCVEGEIKALRVLNR